MKILDPGHHYELDALDTDDKQTLLFVKREGHNYPGNIGAHPGVLTQEVLRVLIDRCEYMNAQGRCAETDFILANLRNALMMFEVRAARCRGTSIDLKDSLIEKESTCTVCGHIQCDFTRHDGRPHWSSKTKRNTFLEDAERINAESKEFTEQREYERRERIRERDQAK